MSLRLHRRATARWALAWAPLLALAAWTSTRTPAAAEARDAFARGDINAALTRALDQLDRSPGHAPTALIAARCLSRRGFPAEAEPYYARAGGPGRDRDAWLDRSAAQEAAGDWDRLAAACSDRLAIDPDDPDALRRLARAEAGRGRRAEALAAAERLAGRPGAGASAIGWVLVGRLRGIGSDKMGAADAFARAVARDPMLALPGEAPGTALMDAATAAVAAGRAQVARDWLRDALGSMRDPPAHLLDYLAFACLQAGDPDAARENWRRSAARDGGRATPWLELGRLALRDRKVAEALECLERAERIVPDDYQITYNLALAHRMAGRSVVADGYARRAARLRALQPAAATGM